MAKKSNSIYNPCEPDNHQENVTYHQFTNFDQAFIVNEENIGVNTCGNVCEDYQSGSVTTCDYGKFPCSHPCKTFFDCTSYGDVIYTCRNFTPSKTRRYNFIQHGDKILTSYKCPKMINKAKVYWRFMNKCQYCVCFCDHPVDNSDRYVSLENVVTDETENEVITGLRLVKFDQIIYFQIQVGKMMHHNYIDQKLVRWLPIQPHTKRESFTLRRRQKMNMDYLSSNSSLPMIGCVMVKIYSL